MSDPLAEIVEIAARALHDIFNERQPFGPTRTYYEHKARRLISALTAASYAIVPRAPTAEMIDAAPVINDPMIDDDSLYTVEEAAHP